MKHGFLSRADVEALGLLRVGEDVQIDATARFYGAGRIAIGSRTRIDAYAVLSAGPDGIEIGDNVHLAVGVVLVGAGRIVVRDFAGLSAHTAVYSSNDDYSGASLTGPTVPQETRDVATAPVLFDKHAIVGAGSVILPGVTVGLGSAVGALSLVRQDVPAHTIVAGAPARVIGQRSDRVLALEASLLATECRAAPR